MKNKAIEKKDDKKKRPKSHHEIDYRKYDNLCRDSHISSILRTWVYSSEFLDFQDFSAELRADPIYTDINFSIHEAVVNVFEHMITLFQLGYTVMRNKREDSVSLIEPAVNDRYVSHYMGNLTELLPIFPYSFYRKLDLKNLTFVGKMSLKNKGHRDTYLKKYYNWNFMVDEQHLPEEIRFHFLSVVWFNASRLMKNFHEQWIKLYPKDDLDLCKELIYIPNKIVCYPEFSPAPNATSQLLDQFSVFEKLIEDPKNLLESENEILREKAYLIKNCLQSLDPEGLSDQWWNHLQYSRP